MDWIIALNLIALVLFFFEIFLPGGVLLIVGILLMGWSWALAYVDYGLGAAALTAFGSLTIGVTMFLLELYLLPRTRWGRLFFLRHTQPDPAPLPEQEASLVGRTGETLTTLAPGGRVQVDGQTREAVSRSGLLRQGTPVVVVGQDRFRLVVEKADETA